jgi:hypothetical protein
MQAIHPFKGRLYAGGGSNGSNGDIYICTPNATGDNLFCDQNDWRKANDSTIYDGVLSFEEFNNKLYVGLGETTGEGDIYVCNPEKNTTNLGEGLKECDPNEWDIVFEDALYATLVSSVGSLESFNGRLYAGLITASAGIGDIVRCDPAFNTTGEATVCNIKEWNMTFDGAQEEIKSLETFNGRLFAGQGSSATTDGDVFVCEPSKIQLETI